MYFGTRVLLRGEWEPIRTLGRYFGSCKGGNKP
jgi:hypothetical protein